jgi:RNA-directed DNA polymerase
VEPLIRRIVKAGVWTPEGIEARGKGGAGHADDCQILVSSERAGQRVIDSVTRLIEESLRITVNARKSAVDRPWNRKFMGFTLTRCTKGLKVAAVAIDKLKGKLRELSRRTRCHRLEAISEELRETLLGWKTKFRRSQSVPWRSQSVPWRSQSVPWRSQSVPRRS